MRIVFVSYHYSSHIKSPQEWIKVLQVSIGWLEYLAKEHLVVCVNQMNYEGAFTNNGVQYYCLGGGKENNHFPHKLNKFVKELIPDVVVISGLLFPIQTIQLRFYLGKQVKFILQHHAEQPFKRFKKYLQRFAINKADVVLFTSHEMGEEWVQSGNLKNTNKVRELMEVSSLFYPISQDIAREQTRVEGSLTFLWVGRLNSNKDPLTAIAAFLKFAELQPMAKLYMVYQTKELEQEVQEFISKSHYRSSIVLIGNVPHEQLIYWFNSVDFFLAASHYEGSGTALCEAMSCGCIPIVSNIPSFRKICGHCGLLFQTGNEQALLTSLNLSVDLDILTQREKILEEFKSKLSFGSIASTFQNIVDALYAI